MLYESINNGISIRAPARGATGKRCVIPGALIYFNPRSREGSDKGGAFPGSRTQNFNPRSREGSDLESKTENLPYESISIRAPARGATGISNRI